MSGIFKSVYVDQDTDVELKPPPFPDGRSYIFIQNNSDADIYYSEGTMATVDNAIVLKTNQWLELSLNLGNAVPKGSVWLKGTAASPTRQRVLVKEG